MIAVFSGIFSYIFHTMAVVFVAGGLGDLGRPITDALFESGKYEAYIMTRKVRYSKKGVPSHIADIYHVNVNADCGEQLVFGAYLANDWQTLPPHNSD
jgi:hypothetical protein